MNDRTLWTWHVGAGLVILVLLGLHMTIMHLDATVGAFGVAGAKPIDWPSVLLRMKSLGFAFSYVALLGAALYHGLYGLRNILLELNPRPALRATVSYGLLLLGFALFFFGTYVAVMAPAAAAGLRAGVGG